MKRKILSLLVITIFAFLFTACDAEMNADADEYVGKNYKEVVSDLKDAGFENIKLTKVEDLTSDGPMDDGDVESVSIKGESNFKKGDSFPEDSKVKIRYHCIKKVKAPVGSTDVKDMDVMEIRNLFSEEGFENVDVTQKYDLDPDKTDKNTENEIAINDNSSFEKSDKFPFDAKVLITCHHPYRVFDATIKVNFASNIIFSKYDVVFSVDENEIGQHKHGKSWKDELSLKEGERTLTFTSAEDPSVQGEVKLKMDSDLEAKYSISCYDDRIDVEEEYVGSKKDKKSSEPKKKAVNITAKNSKDFAKLISAQDDEASKSFCKKYAGKSVKFKGSIDYIDTYKNYDTRFNVLVSAWDYNKDSQKGPTFKFENIGAYVLDGADVGDNVTIKAKVESFDENTGIIYLYPIEVKKR